MPTPIATQNQLSLLLQINSNFRKYGRAKKDNFRKDEISIYLDEVVDVKALEVLAGLREDAAADLAGQEGSQQNVSFSDHKSSDEKRTDLGLEEAAPTPCSTYLRSSAVVVKGR
ncbi:hypothetical protein E2562_026683 [Oryza meyeriana var. granulata]|uniref:Uncharacterized protein n=1 Tax=Oryza meyeriana var. granulata TaxID=110450 RepID=A0A6G1BZW8_9ORYZ|nr:hypothetical protein E2562_026683 [Oryza meyeriana var. granulata]